MDALTLSRIQFGFTIGFHILWPAFTVGVASFVAFLSLMWWRTGEPVYGTLMRFWIRIFALGFGMGVVTGLVLSYELGTNWSGFSRSVSNVIGPFFAYEVMTAFFLEAGFIGIVLFGDGRVSRGMHFLACLMVAVGTLVSTGWIIASNSWMQTPAGYTIDQQGIFHVSDWWAAVFTPSWPYRFAHMVCASFVTGSFVVAGVSAYHLWRGRHLQASRKAFSLALWAATVLVPAQLLIGDFHGRNTLQYQPTKLAAMEGLWDSGNGAAATIIGWPDMSAERNLFEIAIPHAGSIYLTHSWNGFVQGLKAVPAADRPYVPIVFFAFRIMVGIGLLLLAVTLTGGVLRWRGRLYATRWFQLACMAATPLGFVAVIAGWTVTETGRQPFVVYGHLRTADAVSPVATGAVLTSLLLFFVVYNLLLAAVLWYGARVVMRGPDPIEDPHPDAVRPGLEQAAPTLLRAPSGRPALVPGE